LFYAIPSGSIDPATVASINETCPSVIWTGKRSKRIKTTTTVVVKPIRVLFAYSFGIIIGHTATAPHDNITVALCNIMDPRVLTHSYVITSERCAVSDNINTKNDSKNRRRQCRRRSARGKPYDFTGNTTRCAVSGCQI